MTRPVAVLGCALLLAACASDDTRTSAAAPLQIFAAASLSDVLQRIDDSPRYQFAGSDELALQIREGARADLYAAASPRYPLELAEEKMIEEPVAFATNELVLIVPRDNPARIEHVSDLDNPEVKLVIAAQGVPVGDYTRAVFENLGANELLDRVVSEEQDAKAVVSKVVLGEADAGVVYVTDVVAAGDDVRAIALPSDSQPTIQYMVAVTSDSDRREAAEEFVDLLLSDRGQGLLRDAGFGPP